MPYLDTRQGHQLYYRLSGPQGSLPPVVFVHGGPGAACQPQDEQLFSQCQRQVVWLDQRGCGKSRSEQPLENNTSDHLIEDMERLRLELGIEKWVLVGGSWGSALSLAYGIKHPQRVAQMILWGIFTCSQAELNWFYIDGARHLFPEEYQRFIQPVAEHENPIDAYHRLVSQGPAAQREQAASRWARWEAVNSFINPSEQTLDKFSDPKVSLPMVLLETWYFMQGGFFAYDNYIMENLHKLGDLRVDIVQGQYDTICPMTFAWQVASSLANSQLHISPMAAHDASEGQNRERLQQLIAAL
ncbi:prolyl aminopeptidase [Lacimicrobium alkaliphilum]|uniref:Proline iminopeptidase n=1 Tax=Lacimicrobium alkaliphilum TaxID=1526571 RepID=A0A0U3AV44_9ALTE|nr:prolyl aminopeptidase [Lacimicrobium alkaliphilum]ALS97967.1 hypothetical protein AT746_06605 [Lacimicrobium alkaliphilum]